MEKNNPVLEKIKNMSREEILKYYTAAETANRLVNITGITVLFSALVLSNTFIFISAGVASYFLAKLAVDISSTMSVLEKTLYPDK